MAPVEPWFNSSSSSSSSYSSFPFKECNLGLFKVILMVSFSLYCVVLTIGVCCDCVLPEQHLQQQQPQQQEQEQEQQPPEFVPYKYSRFL